MTEKKPLKYQLNFENKLASIALVLGLIPTVGMLLLLYRTEISIYPKILFTLLSLSAVVYGAHCIWTLVTGQLKTSTNLLEAIINGDFTMRPLRQHRQGALNEFNQLLNQLANDLADEKLQSREKQILLHKVMAQIEVAILATDQQHQVTLMNPAAEKLLGKTYQEVSSTHISNCGLVLETENHMRKVQELFSHGKRTKVYIHTDSFFENGQRHNLIFITDIQQILREEERLAWKRLLRVLSHEINNSLAPISSIGESLSSLLIKENETEDTKELMIDLSEGLALITERANSLNQFIQRYQTLTRLPLPDKSPVDIGSLLSSITPMFSRKIAIDGKDLQIYADEAQLQQVFINMLKNAEEAMDNNPTGEIKICWYKEGNQLNIHVLDEGRGINNPDNIFVPFYTTKENGCGIGLVLSRQILMNHSGDLTLENRKNGIGAKVTIVLPLLST